MCVSIEDGRRSGLGENTGSSPISSRFSKLLLSTYYEMDIVLHNGETSDNKTGDVCIFMEVMGEKRGIGIF